ncbi:MAG: metal-sensitive transcriptional regulator [Chloroflexota bacterium]|nr:metal-sensitive transcriptional regulator [Chloroflexota bacterium]
MPTAQQRTQILNRLKSVDGHLKGVIKMVDEDAYCMDVIKQLQAVQGAIGRVNVLLLQDHLQTCVTTAIRGDAPAERERVIGELLGLFEHGARPVATTAGPATAGPAGASAVLVAAAATEITIPESGESNCKGDGQSNGDG